MTVNDPRSNTVQLTELGGGRFQAEWDGGSVHSFTGIQTVDVLARRARRDQITINLPGPVIASRMATALQGATPEKRVGTATQSGSVLDVTADSPKANTVQVLDQGGGVVQVEWNGGAAHSFAGVTTIIIRTERAANDRITLETPPLT